MQKILLLADSNSSHIEKWAISLANKGYTIGLFSLNKSKDRWYDNNKNIVLLFEPSDYTDNSALKIKLKYLLKLPLLLKKIKEFEPDILHAHYATSYGLLGSLSRFRPFILSVWGSDVFEFPRKSYFHKVLFKWNLKRTDKVLSTSHAMKKELSLYTKANVEVTPFGVDTRIFHPHEVKNEEEKQILYFGIIKSIEDKYGIGAIIKAIQILKCDLPDFKFRVLFVGNGGRIDFYKKLVIDLGLNDIIIFTGKVASAEIPFYHNMLDIFLNVSIVNESFGVSVIEAMACGKPVIVTNASGLTEIVKENTGIVIKMNDANALANAIKKIIENPELRKNLGEEAMKHVKSNYELNDCVNLMENIYKEVFNYQR